MSKKLTGAVKIFRNELLNEKSEIIIPEKYWPIVQAVKVVLTFVRIFCGKEGRTIIDALIIAINALMESHEFKMFAAAKPDFDPGRV